MKAVPSKCDRCGTTKGEINWSMRFQQKLCGPCYMAAMAQLPRGDAA